MIKYKLIENDHGMGGPEPTTRRVIAHFTNLGRAHLYFQSEGIRYDYDGQHKDFDLDDSLYKLKEGCSNLGRCDYTLTSMGSDDGIPVDPTSMGSK